MPPSAWPRRRRPIASWNRAPISAKSYWLTSKAPAIGQTALPGDKTCGSAHIQHCQCHAGPAASRLPDRPEERPVQLLMPKATAVWLVENTSLTLDQIAAFCGLHPLEVQAIA